MISAIWLNPHATVSASSKMLNERVKIGKKVLKKVQWREKFSKIGMALKLTLHLLFFWAKLQEKFSKKLDGPKPLMSI